MSNKVIPRFKPRHDNVYELNKKQEDFLYDLYYNKHFTFGRDRLFQYIQVIGIIIIIMIILVVELFKNG